jgi:hypothetical protein
LKLLPLQPAGPKIAKRHAAFAARFADDGVDGVRRMKRDDLRCMAWARAIGGVRRRSDRKPLPSRELKQTMAHEDGRITDVHGLRRLGLGEFVGLSRHWSLHADRRSSGVAHNERMKRRGR